MKKILFSFDILRQYSDFMKMRREEAAIRIQRNYLNSKEKFKEVRMNEIKLRNYQVNEELMKRSVGVIKRFYEKLKVRVKERSEECLRELFKSHYLYFGVKKGMEEFLLSYRLSKGVKKIIVSHFLQRLRRASKKV